MSMPLGEPTMQQREARAQRQAQLMQMLDRHGAGGDGAPMDPVRHRVQSLQATAHAAERVAQAVNKELQRLDPAAAQRGHTRSS